MFFRTSMRFGCLIALFSLVACNGADAELLEVELVESVSVEANASSSNSEIAPLSREYADYAQETIRAFYANGIEEVRARAHSKYKDTFSGAEAAALESSVSKSASLADMEFFGHMYGEEENVPFTVVQYNVPNPNGRDEVRVVMSNETKCCEIVGFHIDTIVRKNSDPVDN